MSELKPCHIEILTHTGRNGVYNGFKEDPDIAHLLSLGLLRYIGSPSWQPADYFRLTEHGWTAIESLNQGER